MGPTSQAVVFQMTPVLGALIGVVATLIVVAIVIVFLVRTRERGAASSTSQLDADTNAKKETSGQCAPVANQEEEPDPDVVPIRNGNPFISGLVTRVVNVYITHVCRIYITLLVTNILQIQERGMSV